MDLTACAQDIKRNRVRIAAKPEIDARQIEPQIAQRHFLQERGQARIVQANFALAQVEFESGRGFEQLEWGGTGPGPRRAGDRIERGHAATLALKAAIEFRQLAPNELPKSKPEAPARIAIDPQVARKIKSYEDHLRKKVAVNERRPLATFRCQRAVRNSPSREPCYLCFLFASFGLISGLSYKTTFSNELWISSLPLYSM